MYDARPVSEPLRLDPTQPRTNGRVYRIPFNDVPKEYERAERLVLEGRLVEAERVLNKVLEMAQSHHKARRLLNQVRHEDEHAVEGATKGYRAVSDARG